MLPKLKSTFFIANRQALRTKMPDKLPIVIAGNGLLQRTADTTLPFAQDSNFWYLTGLDMPDAVVVIDANQEFLIVPERSVARQAFDGSTDTAVIAERSGIKVVMNETDGWALIAAATAKDNRAGFLKPLTAYEKHHGFYANPARRKVSDRLRRTHPRIELYDVRKELATLRCIKQEAEIELIEFAVRITKDTLREITHSTAFLDMKYEYELEAAITNGFRKSGATGHAYSPIVASGANATTLHYDHNTARIERNDYIVVDVGAEIEHYAADITRTIMQEEPSKRQQAIYDSVQCLQNEALSLLKPGILLRDYESDFEHLMGRELKRLGLITDDRDHFNIRRYYPHATSHFLGLDVHDVGDYTLPLETGMVLTCEPGIYIPEEGIGVRLEDDVLITDSGARVL